jgi:hypothetical protein
MNNRLHSSAVTYNDSKGFNEMHGGLVSGEPYIVRAESKKWIPVNVIVFAISEKDAIERVKQSLVEADKLDDKRYHFKNEKGQYLIERYLELSWSASRYDKSIISNVAWAENDNITLSF